jgi:hypothetical protein
MLGPEIGGDAIFGNVVARSAREVLDVVGGYDALREVAQAFC